MPTDKRVVVYGASGYTGRLICEYLREFNIPFLAAGRNEGRVKGILDVVPGIDTVEYDVVEVEHTKESLVEAFRGAEIVLFTDQWGSPVSGKARHVFSANVEALTSWDSTMALMFLVEALIADVSNRLWSVSRERVEELEEMFDCLGTFGGGHDNGGA